MILKVLVMMIILLLMNIVNNLTRLPITKTLLSKKNNIINIFN